MSFLKEIKNELCDIKDVNICCKKSELYAFLLLGGFFYGRDFTFKAKNDMIRNRFNFLTSNSFYQYFSECEKNGKTYFRTKGEFEKNKLLFEYGYNDKIIALHINDDIIETQCCKRAFLRGVFLMCASMSEPKSGYKIEFDISRKILAEDIFHLVDNIKPDDNSDCTIKCRLSKKKNSYAVFINTAQSVEEFLAFIGAGMGAMDIIQLQMVNDERKHINRKNNFDIANITKSAKASADQLNAIRIIKEKNLYNDLKDNLKIAAKLRCEYPEASLETLCRISNINKSSLYYRLNRLITISKNL